MQNDPNEHVVDDADGLTEAERAELTADEASGGAPTGEAAAAPAAPAPEQEPTPAPTPEPEPKPDPRDAALTALAETQAQTAAALAKVTENMERREQPPAQQEPEPPKEPDWEAERKALKQRFDDGDLDDDEFERERETLLERRAEWRAEQRAAALVSEHLEKAQKQAAQRQQEELDRQWETSMQAFMAVEANATLLSDQTRVAAFNAVLAAVAQEQPNATYAQMLDEARDRTMKAFNMTPPAPPADDKKKVADAVAARKPGATPPDLSRAPAAGFDNERGGEFKDLDDLDIDELENRLAHMKDEDVERFLETAPGGLLDNPRG